MVTTWESQYTTIFSALAAFARSSPAMKALYYASLLVVGKSRWTMRLILSPSRLWSTTPAPPACLLKDPSVWMIHCGISSTPWPSTRVNSTMKSAATCPFMAVHVQYCMSNSLNSIAHNAIRPTALGLLIALCRGLSVRTITMCAWKYGLSFRATVTNAKMSFSIYRYLSSAPWSARFKKYIGFCTLSSSLTKATLTANGETARYRNSSSPT